MKRIPQNLLSRMSECVSDEDRDEMAIPSYQHRNPLLRWMAWRRLEVVATFFRDSRGKVTDPTRHSVMDFGCGTGVLFDEASQLADQVYGIDIVLDPARLLVSTWDLGKVTLLNPDEAKKVLPSQSIDTIIAAEVLEHIEPLDETLEFFRDRLKPGGTLLVSLPTESALYRLGRRLAGFHGHYHESNAASIHPQILRAGFKQVRMQKIPAPGPFAIYWVIEYQ